MGGDEEKRKVHWVKWDQVLLPKEKGGLGLQSLQEANSGMISKWAWRYKTEKHRLWRRVIAAIHGGARYYDGFNAKKSLTGVWCNIFRRIEKLENEGIKINILISCSIGNGLGTSFWSDRWCGNQPLRSVFPELFKADRNKACRVAERIDGVNHGLNWNPSVAAGVERSQLHDLRQLLTNVRTSAAMDAWSWDGDTTGLFSVKAVRKLLRQTSMADCGFIWNSWVPAKVNLCGWRIFLERLPTKLGLHKRNINCGSIVCPLCEEAEESEEHLFASCFVATSIWNFVSVWCKIPMIYAFSTPDLFQIHKSISNKASVQKSISAVILTSCWALWNARNNKVFNGRRTVIRYIMEHIKISSYLWIKARSKLLAPSWEQWKSFDIH